MRFAENAPASPTPTPPPAPPAPAAAPVRLFESIVAFDVPDTARLATLFGALPMVEFTTVARTVCWRTTPSMSTLPTLLLATEMPKPTPTPAPAPPAPASPAEPATASIVEVSLALTVTVLGVRTVLALILASIVLAMALIDSAPAPETATPAPAPPAPERPKPTDHVWIVAFAAAVTDTVPVASTVAPPWIAAVTVTPILLIARELARPTATPAPAPPAPAAASAPASELTWDVLDAVTSTLPA